jgi:hypothetical protein
MTTSNSIKVKAGLPETCDMRLRIEKHSCRKTQSPFVAA